jgi:hypothetical protein
MARWEHKTRILIGLLTALAVGLAACGDDETDGDQDGPIGERETPQVHAEPDSVVFRQVAIGESTSETIFIENRGEGTLRISDITLREESGSGFDNNPEFWESDGFEVDGTISLEQFETHQLTVEYAPVDQVPDEGAIFIESNDPNRSTLEVPLSTPTLDPQIYSAPTIAFERVPPRPEEPNWEGEFQLTDVQNTGASPLTIDDIYVSGSERFSVTFPQPTDEEIDEGMSPSVDNDVDDWPQTLDPNESFPIRVWFLPEDNLPDQGELIFESNDPDNPQYIVNLSGNSGSPCIQVSPSEELNFGQASLGQTTQKTVTIENCSRSSELEISNIAISDDGGGAYGIQDGSLPDGLPGGSTTLEAGERSNFVVTFVPTSQDTYDGELQIESNDPASRDLRVPITGIGTDNQCPTADAKGWLQGGSYRGDTIETIPLNTIQFDGSDSTDPDGSIARYEWTILTRPQGSSQRLTPDNNVEKPRLFLDLAGVYEVELKVYDNENSVSCGDPAIITIIAEPDDDIHVQLVWDTPSDPDQENDFGTDLDLHYLHPNGRWDVSPWDIFWRNPTADWGRQGDPSDDPSLDIDDTAGLGPENINHSDPENLQYRTGVYYYNDNGFGASYATLRVYIRGQLEVELANKYMAGTGTFWDAATIAWPSGNVTNQPDRIYQGFP